MLAQRGFETCEFRRTTFWQGAQNLIEKVSASPKEKSGFQKEQNNHSTEAKVC